jgi:salicylate hydroxylase
MTEVAPLNVAVVGGGLAGALAARVLRDKHNVTIYERAQEASEVGAAINVGPNGVRTLEELGFDRAKVRSIPVGAIKTWNKEGELLMDSIMCPAEDYGADWLFNHRADLRDEFLRLATADSQALGISGAPAKVRFGVEVVDVDIYEGKLTLANGEVIHADLIVGEQYFLRSNI